MNNHKDDISFIQSKWLKKRYFKNKSLYKTARYLITISINYLLERDERQLTKQNENISQSIKDINQHIETLEEKFHTSNQISLFLDTPMNIYIEQRISRLHESIEQYLADIQQEIQDEIQHWKNIYSIISRPLSTVASSTRHNKLNQTKKPTRHLALINTNILDSSMNRLYKNQISTNKSSNTFIIDSDSDSDTVIYID